MTMQYRQMGRSGLRLSAVSLGGWLTFGGSVDRGTTRATVAAALDAGVNFLDLADVYARGGAEEAVGEAIAGRPREELVLSSKVFGRMGDGPNQRGLSRKHIMESIEGSLRRLGTDYLDLYFCHRADPETPLDETLRAMDDLVRRGKVHYWGTSMWAPELIEEAIDLCERRGLYPPAVEQPEYSLVARGAEARLLPLARRAGLGVVAWSPLGGGLLTGKYDEGVPEGSRGATTKWLEERLTDGLRERLRAFSAIARRLDCAPSALALAWLLGRDEVSSVITGATRPEQVLENVTAAEMVLEPAVAQEIDGLFPAAGA